MRKRGQTVLLGSFILFITFFNLEIPKRAFRLYERGDIEKTVETLDKSIEKDTLNPAAYYLYSILYTDTAFYAYNVDTAFQYVNKAFAQLKTIKDPGDLEDLAEYQTDSLHLEQQKDLIDSLKFQEIIQIHTIKIYEQFIEKHADAKQVPNAIANIHSIAFQKAQETHTWEAYKGFIDEYPKAQQFNRADSLYKLLIYEEKTADGKLDSFNQFLEEFPGTPYRDKIVPKIFTIATATNRIEDYKAFLLEHPSDSLQKVAYSRIYHVFKEKYGSDEFLKYFPSPDLRDSILVIQQIEKGFWIPKLTDNKIEFVDSEGRSKLKTPLTQVSDRALCEPILNDFVYGKTDNGSSLISRDGQLIYTGDFQDAQDTGYGFISLKTEEGFILIHKSGKVIIDEPVEEIKVLSESFIRTSKNNFYGLESINGLSFLDNEFVMIDTLEQYLWLEKEDGIALVLPNVLYPALDGESIPLEFTYDDVSLLDNGRIWVARNGQEAILDDQLRTIIPLGNYEIYDESYGWKLVSENGIRVIHDRYSNLSEGSFERVEDNEQWLATYNANRWTLYDQIGNLPVKMDIDSLAFLGENMVMLQKGDSLIAQFKTGKQLLMEDDWEYKLLVPQEYIKTGKPALHDFFMLSNSKNYRKIYNEFGREILSATFNEAVALGPNMLRLQKRNAALADSTGHYMLNFIYDGIGSNDNGYVSVLDKGKFGVINPDQQINIAPEYEKLITPYSDTVLVATKDRYKGFINTKNKVLTAFEFDEVKYFNDSIALVRIENEWLLENIRNEEILYERILDFEIIEVGDEDKTLFINTESGQGIFSETLGEVIEPTYTYIRILGTQKDPIYFAVKLVEEANIYVVIYYDQKGNKLFTQSFRQEEYFKIACPAN